MCPVELNAMLLCLDVGNSQIFGGVFDGGELKTTFRRTSSIRASSDEFGMFFRAVLRENGVDPERIDMAAICSVVPDAVHSLRNCFRKYFHLEPFLLQPARRPASRSDIAIHSKWARTRLRTPSER